jgi:asparagine synthase (glutamine-hydrolysing)
VILKELMRDRLPASILSRKKIGLDVPVHEWFRGPLRPVLAEALDIAREHASFFNVEAIEDIARTHMDRRANLGYHLWGLMTLFLWIKKWRIQTTPLAMPEPRAMENVFTSI